MATTPTGGSTCSSYWRRHRLALLERTAVVVGATGPAPGAGTIVLDARDVRVGGEDLSMWWLEGAFGLPGQTIAARLVGQVGWPKATALVLLGDEAALDPEEARYLGLLDRVEPSEAVDDTAPEMAAVIADHDRQHDTIASHTEAIQFAREKLQGASQEYAGWLTPGVERVLDR